MRVVKGKSEEPKVQTHQEIYTSPIGYSVVGVLTEFHDGTTDHSIYLDDTNNPERFEVIGVYDDTLAGEIQSENTALVVRRVLEAIEELREGA